MLYFYSIKVDKNFLCLVCVMSSVNGKSVHLEEQKKRGIVKSSSSKNKRTQSVNCVRSILLVPGAGFEPARPEDQGILSLFCSLLICL